MPSRYDGETEAKAVRLGKRTSRGWDDAETLCKWIRQSDVDAWDTSKAVQESLVVGIKTLCAVAR